MADRVDFYFRQRVTEAELDLAFEQLEQADRALASDLNIFGIVSGAVPVPHAPVADLSIDLVNDGAPARAYDRAGRRIAFALSRTVDCSVDLLGVPTAVLTPGNERWVGVFLKFDRVLADPRTDGNSQTVYFRRDESYDVVVRQGPDAAAGSAARVGIPETELLVCDVRITHGQTHIVALDIDTSRRQAFVFASGEAVAVAPALWSTLLPATPTVQSALDAVDGALTAHFAATGHRHTATAIDFVAPADIAGANVQAAIADLVARLVAAADVSGADLVRCGPLPGAPYGLAAAPLRTQLAAVLGWLNAHVSAAAGAHAASAIAAAAHNWLSAPSVQGQLQELVAELAAVTSGRGAARVGNVALSGAPYVAEAGTVAAHLQALLSAINAHVAGPDHDGRYWRRTEQVADADTVDGLHAAAFATAGHDHDDRYVRRIYHNSLGFDPGQTITMGTMSDKPDFVVVAYNLVDGLGTVYPTTFGRGAFTDLIEWWVTKVSSGGDKDYELTIHNGASEELFISASAFARD